MGGGAGAKRESNSERTARLIASKKSGGDARALRLAAEYQKRAKRRPALFGGPETGTAAATLGGQSGALGVMV